MLRLRLLLLSLAALLFALGAQATTIILPTDEQLIAKTPVIVEGTVVSSAAAERHGGIYTETVIDVARVFKGEAPRTITVRELGGELGNRITKIFGSPEYAAGERTLLFLDQMPDGAFRTVDLFVGKFTAAETLSGERLWLRESSEKAMLLDADLRPVAAASAQRDAARFESFIAARVAGRHASSNYAVENPVTVSRLAEGARTKYRSDFTLIDEPTVYRWTSFDNGQSASWYSDGTQSGYSGGGITELRTAIAAWSSYSSANVRYSYAGSRSGAPGGLDGLNGVNEVIFNDPLDEIAGKWDGSTSGVVGIGGFNGYVSGPNWTAPFTADDSHTAGVKSTITITEGNLTIQDGVSASTGISSNVLAEIIAHELGHTLGFGHSGDSNALMYQYVVGLGPSLRADDMLAARWLYPNGSAPPPPAPDAPAAPTNLRATPSGTNVDLAWNDNATNESGYAIFIAAGGSFVNVGSVGANAVSARVSGFSSGSFRAYVAAFNGSGTSAPSNIVDFTIAAPPPVAAFTMSPLGGTVAQPFFFYDQSTGTIASRLWDFGDGTTSTDLNPTHAYSAAGAYTVTLTVTGGGASSSASRTINVSGPLAAAFVWSPSAVRPSDVIHFTDQSTGAPDSWHWTFGDGTSSNEQNPTKSFSVQGVYTITLTASRAGSTSSASKTLTVSNTVPATPAVLAAFDMSDATPAPGATVTFTDRSTGAPSSWHWAFGDGTTSTAQNPAHVFATAGVYAVTLTVSNATTSATASRQVTVTTNEAFRTLVSVAAHTAGASDTAWRTELTLFNAGTSGANVTLLYLPTTGGTVRTNTIFLAPSASSTYADALQDLFAIDSGAGAIAIDATSAGASADLRVTSRTFTGGGAAGTYGQSVPDVASSALDSTLFVTGMQANDAFRTNVGFANRSTTTVGATLTLYTANGGAIATKQISLPAGAFQQSSLTSYFPEVANVSYDVLSMRIDASATNALSAYASVVDNVTQDPVYIQAMPAPAGSSLTIPVVGRAEGANGTFWRSDAVFFNPTGTRMVLGVVYAGEAPQSVVLEPRRTVVLADVVSRFGRASGNGSLFVSWSTPAGPVVTSRTYTTVAAGGTYGQSIAPVSGFATRVFVAGLRHDGSYRSNLGIVNRTDAAAVVRIALLAPSGATLAETSVPVGARSQVQWSVTALFPQLTSTSSFTMRAESDTPIFAYGSMVDNASGDPVFFAGR